MTTFPNLDPAVLGEISRGYNIHYERRSKHPPARVWRAITTPEEIERWVTFPARVDLRIGGDYFIDFQGNSPDNIDGVIVRLEAERRLAFVWGLSVLEWTIEPAEGGGSRYTFIHHGMPVRGRPDEEGVAAGWHTSLDRFDLLLEDEPIPTFDDAGWRTLSAEYRARIEAAIGAV